MRGQQEARLQPPRQLRQLGGGPADVEGVALVRPMFLYCPLPCAELFRIRGGPQEEQSFKRRMGYVAADATPASVHGGGRTTTPGM